MPLYDYKCHKCGDVFEVKQSFSDEPLKVHEACGGDLERLISAPALQFKGSGWYITDYAKGSNSSGPSKSSGNGDGAKSEGGSKTSTTSNTPSTEKK